MQAAAANANPLFPSFDALESVIWPGVALAVFVLTAVLVDLMVVLAARWRLVDLPNRRSAHALPTARGGGLAIAGMTTLAAIAVVLRWPPDTAAIVLGAFLPSLAIAAVGIVDDMNPLNATLRLCLQVAVAAWMTAVLGPIRSVAIPGLPALALGAAAWPITMLWIVGMINAFNFMDGADGMAATAAVVGGAGLAALGLATRSNMPLLLAAFAASAAGGFLVFNWQPARVFMGDVGSGFLGTLLAAIPLLFPESRRAEVIVPAALCLWPTVFDPFVTVIRRIAAGANPLEPHREFFFHRLVRGGVTHASAAFLYGALAAAGAVAGLLMALPAVPMPLRTAAPLVPAVLAAWLAWTAERTFAASAAGRTAAAARSTAVAHAGDPDGDTPPRGLYVSILKRAIDVVIAGVLVAALLPVMALVWLAVRLALGAPAIHWDTRAGLRGRPIRIAKFRSMREAAGPDGRPLPDAARLGGFGRFLRRTSLDELPQLFSVVAGDMSMVGPRPLPERYVSRYSARQATRLLVRPGLTGWAQIHGRNAVAWPERLEYDARYVELLRRPVAPLSDLWILVATVFQVGEQALTGRGVAAPGSATMEEFLPAEPAEHP